MTCWTRNCLPFLRINNTLARSSLQRLIRTFAYTRLERDYTPERLSSGAPNLAKHGTRSILYLSINEGKLTKFGHEVNSAPLVLKLSVMSNLDKSNLIDGRYALGSILGSGGFGAVYRADEVALSRSVALKLLHISLVGDSEMLNRFLREGRMLAGFRHVNVIRVYRCGVANGTQPYLAMELVEGVSLREEISKNGQLLVDRAVDIADQICCGMSAAHSANILHRDLKPENVLLLPDGTIKLVDFGLGTVMQDDGQAQRLTKTGDLVGSVAYMSPEQCQGRRATHLADIYATGCILYEMLTGRPPFVADNPVAFMRMHCEEIPVDVGLLREDLPPGLSVIIKKALSKQPTHRYESMSALRQDLLLVKSEQGAEIADDAYEPVPSRKSNKPMMLAVLIIVCIGMFAAVKARSRLYVKAPELKRAAGHAVIIPAKGTPIATLRNIHCHLKRTTDAEFIHVYPKFAHALETAIERMPLQGAAALRLQGYCLLASLYMKAAPLTDRSNELYLTAFQHAMRAVECARRNENRLYRSGAAPMLICADAYLATNQFEKALRYYDGCLSLVNEDASAPDLELDKTLGVLAPDLASAALYKKGYCWIVLGHPSRAEQCFVESMDLERRRTGNLYMPAVTALCHAYHDKPQKMNNFLRKVEDEIIQLETIAPKLRDCAANQFCALGTALSSVGDLAASLRYFEMGVARLDGAISRNVLDSALAGIEALISGAENGKDFGVAKSAAKLRERVLHLRSRC